MTFNSRALSSLVVLLALLSLSRAGLAAELEVTLFGGIPVVVTDSRIEGDPATTATEVSVEDPGLRVARATPISNVAATSLLGPSGAAGVSAASETRGLEIVVDRFDPELFGVATGPNGEVRIPILFTGAIALQNPGEFAINRQAASNVVVALQVQSRLTNPIGSPEASMNATAALLSFPGSREIRSSGFLQSVFPPTLTAPASVSGGFQAVLWAEVLPNSADPADRTISVRSWLRASSNSPFDLSASRVLARVDVALDRIRGFFPVTTNPPTR